MNRHPVDELVFVRKEIQRLYEREVWLKKQIATGLVGHVGDEWIANVSTRVREQADVGALKRILGPRACEFVIVKEVPTIRFRRRESAADVGNIYSFHAGR